MSGSKSEMERDATWSRKVKGYGFAMMRWTEMCSDFIGDGMIIKEIRTKTPMSTGGEFLIIIKAEVEGRKLIAFHSAETFEDGMAGALNKLEKQGLNWKDDVSYLEAQEQRRALKAAAKG